MKQAYHHKDLRNALVDEALAMLAETDSHAITLRELARRLGVTHAAPYAHFADKTALLQEVAEIGFARLADSLESHAHGDAEIAFRRMGLAYVAYAREHAGLYRLMFADPDLAADPECEMSPEGQRAFGVLVHAILALEPPPDLDVNDLAVAIWSTVHGIAMLEIDHRISGKTMKSAEDVLDLAWDMLLRGMRGGHTPLGRTSHAAS